MPERAMCIRLLCDRRCNQDHHLTKIINALIIWRGAFGSPVMLVHGYLLDGAPWEAENKCAGRYRSGISLRAYFNRVMESAWPIRCRLMFSIADISRYLVARDGMTAPLLPGPPPPRR